jgi:UDP-N-acetylmuramoyl-L-alanyl-D-glutamate--2,6-diaminopimelate ligase
VFVDYAHNAMSLKSILKMLREYTEGRIVVVFGCGGNRSKERRYEMGEVAGKYADFAVITTDNPRYEEPKSIIKDILIGIKKTDGQYLVIEDRKEAVRYVIENRKSGDVIVVAGKGHETYQEIRGVRYELDDRMLIKEITCTQILS